MDTVGYERYDDEEADNDNRDDDVFRNHVYGLVRNKVGVTVGW